jgi:hypothetical protein
MNKIILLGHTSSGSLAVESLLQASGMQAALPSKREGLLPQQITDTLCQAHGCAPLVDAMAEDDLAPQQAGTVWHGLALDLLLGNLHQPLWGWADARSIYWLDYWAQLDPHITFVMVYDHPASALQASGSELLSGQHGTPPEMAVSRLLENWQAYNGAMLQFYSRQPGRCLLVNTQRARQQLADYLAQLGDKLHGRAPPALEALPAPVATEAPTNSGNTLTLALAQAPEANATNLTAWLQGESALDRLLVDQLLQDHPVAAQIYAELEAASTVPATQASASLCHPGQAWLDLIAHRQAISSVVMGLFEQVQTLQQQLSDAKLLANQQQAPVLGPPQVKELEEENELLLTQLHQVQEELERYYLENQALKGNKKFSSSSYSAAGNHYGAAQRIQHQLSYRLGAAMIANSRSLGGWLRMPFALAGQVRAYRADQRAKAGQKLPSIHSYADAHEADRYRQHLSYQLGQTLLKHGKTPWGWLWLPFALAGTAKAFKKARA